MSYAEYATFCRLMGYQVEETAHGIWIGTKRGFFNRVALYETAPPTQDEVETLFRKHRALGMHYAVEPGSRGKESFNYFVRDTSFDLKTLDTKGRWSVKKGLESCVVREIAFDELQHLGMPLNLDTLARQGRGDSLFTEPNRWMQFCHAGAEVESVQAWGAFREDELAAYLVLIRIGSTASLMYHNSRSHLMQFHPSSALFFTVTQNMIRTPGVEAVYNGPMGRTSEEGLDRFKQRMGFKKEPVAFAVQLRPLMRRVMFDLGGRHVVNACAKLMPKRELFHNIQAVVELDVATR